MPCPNDKVGYFKENNISLDCDTCKENASNRPSFMDEPSEERCSETLNLDLNI